MYVIKRTDQGGGFVAKLGSADSYTSDLRRAWIFATREKALAQCCPDNEIPVAIDSLLIQED